MKSKLLLLSRALFLFVILLQAGLSGVSNAQTYVVIGTGSLTNTPVTYPAPYGNFFYGARHQMLILASELTAANVQPNSVISQLGLNVQIPASTPLQNFTIKMAATAATTLTTTFITAGMTQMMDPYTYTTGTGWNTHTFTNGGFVWDGTSNIVVEVCYNNDSWTENAVMYYTTTPSTRCSFRYADATGNCIDPGFLTSTARPNMRLTIGGVNLPPPIAPLANFQFVLGVDTLWERSPSILTNTSTYQDKSYWDITGYNDDSTDGLWDPFYTVRQPNAWGSWIDTVGNAKNFNFKFPYKGYYKVQLTCVNAFGVSTIEKIVFVALPTVKPSAYFFASQVLTGVGESLQMYDASSNGPIGWSWWLDPPCVACGQFINEFFPSNDIPRPVLNANEGGKYTVCMAVWNDIGGDTICKTNYIEIIDGFEICNGNDSVTKSAKGFLHPPYFDTYTAHYYRAQSCPAQFPGFRIAPCADTMFISLERLKLRNQDSVLIRINGFSGPIIRRWGGNNLGALPDSSKRFKYVGQEIFVQYLPGSPNNTWVNDSGFSLRWYISPATFPAPSTSFTAIDTAYSGYKIQFINKTPGTNIAYAWDLNGDNIFGLDNPTFPDSVTTNPTFTFFSFIPVTKKVCLRARNCMGSSTFCKDIVILPIARAPLADFDANATKGFTTDTFYLYDRSQYGASSWRWTFNPSSVTYLMGTSATSQNPIVKLNVAQAYDVTLEATNPFGTTSTTKTSYITTIAYPSPGSVYPPAPSDLDIGITRVVLVGAAGKIDTITPLKNGVYNSYFTSSQALVYRGGKYKIEVYRESAKDAEKARIWIDFNRNTQYDDDSREVIYSEDNINLTKITSEFTVPNDAAIGLTRILIGKASDFSTITPYIATLGVYEDHGLLIAQDKVKPVITLQGDLVYHTTLGQPYVDPGFTATDNIEGDISSRVVVGPIPDISKLGYYKVKYYVTDNYGNVSDTAYRLVQVEINTIQPTLELLGPTNITMEVYSSFNETGYTAKDFQGNLLNQYVVRGGNLDTAKLGTYTVLYSVTDAFNNKATASRTITVVDTKKPVISSRLGSDTVIHEIKTAFEDNDYIKVTDNYWKDVNFARTGGTININKRAIYYLQYGAVDGSGNIADTKPLWVRVKSTQQPSIKLLGEPDIILNVFDSYTELGAVAYDFELTPLVVDITSNLDTKKVGDYQITYSAIDADGNKVQVQRSVRVRDTEAPKIFLLGNDPYYVALDSEFVEPGFKVTDNYYSAAECVVKANYKSVNTHKLGQYFATYDVSDPSGNIGAQKSRMVVVVPSVSSGMNNLNAENGFVLYPNPANSVINIDCWKGEISRVIITDMQGKSMISGIQSLNDNQAQVNLNDYSSGLYLIRIETLDGKSYSGKFNVIK